MAAPGANRPRVFFEISAGTEPLGRVTMELFTDQAPKTCENFRVLCAGTKPPLSYKLSRFHRVIDEFMLQAGDITKGDGTGGESIYGGEFEDENLDWRAIDKEGLLCMANRGKATNSSQFFITLAPCEHLNGKHTVFGRVVTGYPILENIAKVDVDKTDRPLVDVIISRCGELERRSTNVEVKPRNETKVTLEGGRDDHRGRRKRAQRSYSGSSRSHSPKGRADSPRHRQRSSSKTRGNTETKRRRSDYAIDEGIRGRERRTSHSHRAEDKPSYQPVRKRSRSPSRVVQRDSSRSRSPAGYRRRRSLPNHYERREEKSKFERDETRMRTEAVRYKGAASERQASRWEGGRDDRLNDGGGGGEEDRSGIVFKGRGAMKYRERRGY